MNSKEELKTWTEMEDTIDQNLRISKSQIYSNNFFSVKHKQYPSNECKTIWMRKLRTKKYQTWFTCKLAKKGGVKDKKKTKKHCVY